MEVYARPCPSSWSGYFDPLVATLVAVEARREETPRRQSRAEAVSVDWSHPDRSVGVVAIVLGLGSPAGVIAVKTVIVAVVVVVFVESSFPATSYSRGVS